MVFDCGVVDAGTRRVWPADEAKLVVHWTTRRSALRAARAAVDDAERAGGAVTWQVTEDFFTAQNSPDNPARHFGGYITTDVAGGSGTSGGGSLPPGSGGRNPYEQTTIQPQ